MKKIPNGNTHLNIADDGRFFLSVSGCEIEDCVFGGMNSSVALGNNPEAGLGNIPCPETPHRFVWESTNIADKNISVCYREQQKNVLLQEDLELLTDCDCARQTSCVRNDGNTPVKLSRLASATVSVPFAGGRSWHKSDRFAVYVCRNRWQSEAQWHKLTLKECGLYPATSHEWEKCVYRLQSVSSHSTAEYYPILIIEDRDRGECRFFEREGAENWFIELSVTGGFSANGLSVTLGGVDELIGWKYSLAAGESYRSAVSVYGVVKGGFNDAVCALIRYKRKSSVAVVKPMVTFNDYMNCSWAKPTAENLVPLIDKACELGVKRFCIDDGWAEQGVWQPLDENFGSGGLKKIIEYIIKKGMIPGLWFEFERTQYKVAEMVGAKDFILRRDGLDIAEHRPKLNFRCKEAVDYLLRAVDAVYKMGVRYIKNDHNNAEYVGTQTDAESPAEGLRQNEAAFYGFILKLNELYPDLVIENCGSGALRSDNGTLKHFSLQSTSDQEDYRLYPSIAVGSLALMPPEKAGIWSYPYPLRFENIGKGISKEELASFADGRETVFNMVTSMVGQMYLSGRIDLADDLNASLIKEAIEVYEEYKHTLCSRFPVFLSGTNNIYDTSSIAFGLANENDIIIAVWGLNEKEVETFLPENVCKVKKLYPLCDNAVWSYKNRKLSVRFEKEYSAALFMGEK